ncbi:MAG: hydroxymethylglutaryl-CoA synthase [Candidatus Bathyarchaeota archaeon]|nr:hydroxymethylglutaryl-CoA synthase [Candidatus Bathyarchaeota archaeon]MDH5494455.1 hydroxymethylglutaryl-CoA synthase [Candidatus Bathyarchaeota archaeon]
MSSEPIERRVSYIGDRLRGSRCIICGKEYFKLRDYCGACGRESFGKMERIDFFYEEGTLEICTLVNKPTNKFTKLGPYIYGIISFHDDKVRFPARLTDRIIRDEEIILDDLEGRKIVPRFRRRHAVDPSGIVPTISLAFSFADEYYPYQEYRIVKPSKEYEKPGIVGYGVYSSKFRIKEGIIERSIPFLDEDAITAAVEAGKMALIHSGIDHRSVGKVYVGSESNPYAVKPIASKVAQVLKLGEEDRAEGVQCVDAIDTEFACKAATSMFKDAASLVYYPDSEESYAMVIGADNSQSAPRDEPGGELDLFVGYGGCAFIFGMDDVIAQFEGWVSITSDTPDFWRRDTQPYPSHGGRFTGEPAYFKHVTKTVKSLMDRLKLEPRDVDYFVAHQPNAAFPTRVAKSLGFKEEQFLPSLQVAKFGNTYSGCSPIGLAAVLDIAKPNDRILLASYGSGAGSDAYSFIATSQLIDKRPRQKFTINYQVENRFIDYVDYGTYRRIKQGMHTT